MKIAFEISNLADEPDYVHPSAQRYVEIRGLKYADLELPLDDFIERYIRPLVDRCREDFKETPVPLRPGDPFPSIFSDDSALPEKE